LIQLETIQGVWRTEGFTAFRRGVFGNAGQNLYVSRAGVLQRIHQYDLNRDGHIELVLCNSQDHCEQIPADVYSDLLGKSIRTTLPASGAAAATIADLNGDGVDELIVALEYDGCRNDLNSIIYYGSDENLSERFHQQLPTPNCMAVAAGDFRGVGKPDLAFLCNGHVRYFSQQPGGFERRVFVDLPIQGIDLFSADVDGDGVTDLGVCLATGEIRIYWGGPDGINPERFNTLPIQMLSAHSMDPASLYAEAVRSSRSRVSLILDGTVRKLCVATEQGAALLPVHSRHEFGSPLLLNCEHPVAVAHADLDGDGYKDLVVVCGAGSSATEQRSVIFWGGADGYRSEDTTIFATEWATDVCVADFDGDGSPEILVCQGYTAESFTHESLVYRVSDDRQCELVKQVESHSAVRCFAYRSPRDPLPQAIIINHFSRNKLGNVPVFVYWGSDEGFSSANRLELLAWGAVEALSIDLNDDGLPDLLLANAAENSPERDPGSFVFLNKGGAFDSNPDFAFPSVRAHGVCCADLDRDGFLDVVFAGFDNDTITIFHGGPDGFDLKHPTTIKLELDGVVYKEPRWIYLADLNNNGWLDLVVPLVHSPHSLVLWGGPDGFSMSRCQKLNVERGSCVRAADLTGNGYLDLIVGGHQTSLDGPHSSFVHIYWNGPEGIREDRKQLLPANAVNSIAVADFNGDGRRDLFVCSYHDARVRDIDSYIYWNRAGTMFTANDRTRIFTHSASGCFAADFNQDGYIDLAIAQHKVWGDHLGESLVLWNGPQGFHLDRSTRLPSSGPHGINSIGVENLLEGGPEEFYLSEPFELPDGGVVTRMGWEGEVPPTTWVKMQLRFANSKTELAEARWMGPSDNEDWFKRRLEEIAPRQRGRWVQYRLALGATNGGLSPRITGVTVQYVSAKQEPRHRPQLVENS
jgi:hypothetical protein